jgi:hypothetical protein
MEIAEEKKSEVYQVDIEAKEEKKEKVRSETVLRLTLNPQASQQHPSNAR